MNSKSFSSYLGILSFGFPCDLIVFSPDYHQVFKCLSTMKFQKVAPYKYPITFFLYSQLLSSVQSLSLVRLLANPWSAAHQASLSVTNSQSLPKLMPIESVMPSNHLILPHPPFLLPSIFPRVRVFSNESYFCIRWPKYWSFSFSISPSAE